MGILQSTIHSFQVSIHYPVHAYACLT